ncbi:MAG TPA: CsbD family protein [Thermodesulfobacteriota bacterium]|nr:CsbD family protein [Thermodesulfobacteriota bacterium]
MTWHKIEGNWEQLKGKVKEKWGRLTDDDLDVIEGKRDQLVGKLQEKYGFSRERAERETDEWSRTC